MCGRRFAVGTLRFRLTEVRPAISFEASVWAELQSLIHDLAIDTRAIHEHDALSLDFALYGAGDFDTVTANEAVDNSGAPDLNEVADDISFDPAVDLDTGLAL